MHDARSDPHARLRIYRSNNRGDRRRGQVFKRELIEPGQPNVEPSQMNPDVGKAGIDSKLLQLIFARCLPRSAEASSGLGPSDHTSFYQKDIPVLFFFTGVPATAYESAALDGGAIDFVDKARGLPIPSAERRRSL